MSFRGLFQGPVYEQFKNRYEYHLTPSGHIEITPKEEIDAHY